MEAGSAVAGVGAACSGVAVASPVLRRVRSKSRPRSPSASPPVSPARASLRRQAEEVRRAWDPAVPDTTRCLARVHVKHECFRQCTRTANAGRYCAGHKNHMPFGVVGQCVPDDVSAQVVSLASLFRGVSSKKRKRARVVSDRPEGVLLKRQRGEGGGTGVARPSVDEFAEACVDSAFEEGSLVLPFPASQPATCQPQPHLTRLRTLWTYP